MAFLRRARLAVASALVLLVAIAAYWYFSPYLVMRTLHAAADERDVETLNKHVDFPKLRESLKSQLGAAVAQSMKGADGNPFAVLGASVGTMMVNGVVEVLVRPDMLMYSLRTGMTLGPKREAEGTAPSTAPPAKPKVDPGSQPAQPEQPQEQQWRMERHGPDRVIFHPGTQDTGKTVGMVFDRYGFATWKLTAMQLPASAFKRPEPAQ